MSLYLITGGAGFIGSNIAEELIKRGKNVRILDNFSTGKRENIKRLQELTANNHGDLAENFRTTALPVSVSHYANSEKHRSSTKTNTVTINNTQESTIQTKFGSLEFIEGDIRSYHIVQQAVKGVGYILHQAALPSVPRSIKDPITSNEVNVVGTLNILNAAKEENVKRIVYASSSSVYGDLEILPKTEEMLPKPLSPYAVSKLAGEKYCQVFTKLYGIETVILRYFNVFGPYQDPESQYAAVIPKFISLIKEGISPTVFGDGNQSRDFTYVKNIVEANILACGTGMEQLNGEVFNIANGKRITINDLIDCINDNLGTTVKPVYSEPRQGDVKHSLANIGKATQFLNYIPKIDFYDGLKNLI